MVNFISDFPVDYTLRCSGFMPQNTRIYWNDPKKGETPQEETARKQAEFSAQREANIVEGVRLIQLYLKGGDHNPSLLFTRILDKLAEERRALALRQKTEAADQFGKNRLASIDSTGFLEYVITPLREDFSVRYNKVLQDHFALYAVRTSLNPDENLIMMGYLPFFSPCLGNVQESFRVISLRSEDFFKRISIRCVDFSIHNPMFDRVVEVCQRSALSKDVEIKKILDDKSSSLFVKFDKLMEQKQFVSFLKQHAPESYDLQFFISLIIVLSKTGQIPDVPHTHITFVTRYLEMHGKKIELATYGTLHHQQETNEKSEQYFKDNSRFAICHQPPLEAKETLKTVTVLFDQAIRWKKEEGFNSLKEKVMLINYLIQHVTPWSRGSGSAGEELEQIIYRLHGYYVWYRNDKAPPYEALTHSFEEFREEYQKMVVLGRVRG